MTFELRVVFACPMLFLYDRGFSTSFVIDPSDHCALNDRKVKDMGLPSVYNISLSDFQTNPRPDWLVFANRKGL